MATILMGWELGSGLGHVKTLLSVGRELAKHRHEPVFALRNVVEPGPLLREGRFPVLPVPNWPKPVRDKKFLAANFADILAVRGFANADDLEMMVRAWHGLLEVVRRSSSCAITVRPCASPRTADRYRSCCSATDSPYRR